MTVPIEYFTAKNSAHWLADAMCAAIAHKGDSAFMHSCAIKEAHEYLEEIATALGFRIEEIEEPESADPETISAREESYRRQMIDAGRGAQLGG